MRILESVSRDLRYAGRVFRREPAFAVGVVVTFALAIGANAAMFGLVDRLMLAPPPQVRDPEHVVRLGLRYGSEDGRAFTMSTTSYPVFRAADAARDVLKDVAAVRTDSGTVGKDAERTEAAIVAASGAYFRVLGVHPAVGRLFDADDDATPAGVDVVVLGHAYWTRHYAGDAGAIGGTLVVNDHALTIVGVTPRGFNGTAPGVVDLYVPLNTAMRDQDPSWKFRQGARVIQVVARLRDGVADRAAGARLFTVIRNTMAEGTSTSLVATPLESLVPGAGARSSTQARIALWLAGVAFVVLLIATANAATLVLLRAERRRREVATRVALGAPGSRLARQALVEGILLALAGASLGLLLSRWFSDVVRVTLVPGLAPAETIADPRVMLPTILVACGAGLAAELASLLRLRRQGVADDLRIGGHGFSASTLPQRVLAGVQVALCAALLFGAAVFLRSLHGIESQNLGFSTEHLLLVELDFHGMLTGTSRDQAYREAERRILTVPGVRLASVAQGLPFGPHNIPPVNIPGYELPPPDVQQLPILYAATPAWLEMMDVTLVSGRLFTERDDRTAAPVVLVNETMARTAWPGRSAIGQCVRAGFGDDPAGDPMTAVATLSCRTVVGVVRDSRARSLRPEGGEDRLMQYYVPFEQAPAPPVPGITRVSSILVRTDGDPRRVIATIRRLVQGTSEVPVYARVRPYQDLLDPQLRSWRLGASLFSVFGGLALVMATVGLLAVVSYLAARRSREFGVRLALGATRGGVMSRVLHEAGVLAVTGATAGAAVAFAVAPVLQSLLFGIPARDVVSVLLAWSLPGVLTVIAALFPAWRASRTCPADALRDAD